MSVISVSDVSKVYKTKVKSSGLKGSFSSLMRPEYKRIIAVDNINFSVETGEILAFIGPNGAGKSTTIKMLTGILTPSSGKVSVLGYNPQYDRKKLAYEVGTVFVQKSQLWFHLPPIDSFNLLGRIYELESRQLKKRIAYLTDVFEIKELLNIPVRKLSLGQRIRCEIAASMLHEPKIIFLDEPTIGLDVVVKQKIRTLIKTVNQESQTTIFLTSHDVGDIEQLCKRAIVVNDGKIVLNDALKNLKYNYLNKKIIEVKYSEAHNLKDCPYHIIKQKGCSFKVEVDTIKHAIDDVLNTLIGYGRVLDINISEVPLEEVIRLIYQRQGQGEHYA